MELKNLETKCPICGAKNTPVEFTAETGNGTRIKAEYYCGGKIRRLFRRSKPCVTQYRIVLRDEAAERVISEIYLAGGTSYGAGENKEG